jgi:hypothetical protein
MIMFGGGELATPPELHSRMVRVTAEFINAQAFVTNLETQAKH